MGEEGLQSSIADLCQPISCLMDPSEPNDPLVKREFVDPDVPIKAEEDSRDIIDLTWDIEKVEDHKSADGGSFQPTYAYNAEAGPSRLPTIPVDPVKAVLESNPAEMNLDFFCEDDNNMTLEDILGRLHRDQLLQLVKSTRCRLPSRPKV